MRPVLMTCVIAGVGLLPARCRPVSARRCRSRWRYRGGRHDAGADHYPDHAPVLILMISRRTPGGQDVIFEPAE